MTQMNEWFMRGNIHQKVKFFFEIILFFWWKKIIKKSQATNSKQQWPFINPLFSDLVSVCLFVGDIHLFHFKWSLLFGMKIFSCLKYKHLFWAKKKFFKDSIVFSRWRMNDWKTRRGFNCHKSFLHFSWWEPFFIHFIFHSAILMTWSDLNEFFLE